MDGGVYGLTAPFTSVQLVGVPIDVARCSVPVNVITGPLVALLATLIVGVAPPPVEALSAGPTSVGIKSASVVMINLSK